MVAERRAGPPAARPVSCPIVSAGSDLDLRTLTAAQLEAVFESPEPLTVGIEDEVMLLDADTLDLWPGAAALLARLEGDPRFKSELPASQLEIITAPTSSAEEALASLAAGRQGLADAARGEARPAAAGVHPFSPAMGELGSSERYEHIRNEYGGIARRQLVAALQVHVSHRRGGSNPPASTTRCAVTYRRSQPWPPTPRSTKAVTPAWRRYGRRSPSCSPARECRRNRDLGIVRGRAPVGALAGAVGEPRLWWWELRPHAEFGTLEVRVPDAQTSLDDAAGIVGFVHCLAAWLCERHDAGEDLVAAPTWRIEQNRWSAARYGVEGRMADLESGETKLTRERLVGLMGELEPASRRLGSTGLLASARRLADANGAIRQRETFESEGAVGLAAWLAERFLDVA